MYRYLVRAVAFLASSALALAQSGTTGPAAPKDRALDMPLAMLEQAAREIAASGEITKRVLEGGTFSVNVRHIAGSETALQHGKIAEVWVVREGSGTVATGGHWSNHNQDPGRANCVARRSRAASSGRSRPAIWSTFHPACRMASSRPPGSPT